MIQAVQPWASKPQISEQIQSIEVTPNSCTMYGQNTSCVAQGNKGDTSLLCYQCSWIVPQWGKGEASIRKIKQNSLSSISRVQIASPRSQVWGPLWRGGRESQQNQEGEGKLEGETWSGTQDPTSFWPDFHPKGGEREVFLVVIYPSSLKYEIKKWSRNRESSKITKNA